VAEFEGDRVLFRQPLEYVLLSPQPDAPTSEVGAIWLSSTAHRLQLVSNSGTQAVGDVLGAASSVEGELVLFSGVSGKVLTRASTTGLLKATAGVLGPVVSGTDIKTISGQSLLGDGDILVGDVTTDGTQTLLNKTLSSATLSGATLSSGSMRSAVVAVAALNIDCALGNYFTKTVSANSVFTVSNVPSGVAYAFTLELTHTSGTVTWPTAVKWPGDVAPTLTTGKTHLFTFVTDDGGVRWRGVANRNYTN
jgi:hypothetical protein